MSRTIDAPAEEVWALVADITRMAEWSPEVTGGSWIRGATGPAVGARFKGRNANGRRSWSTTCEVTECVPGEVFAFDVRSGPIDVATWSYRFVPTASGCEVTESWTDERPGWFATLTKPIVGVSDRPEHNRRNMEATLEAIDRAATA